MIEAELYDGTVLEFPDGTSPEVIQRVVREQTAQRKQQVAPAPTGPTGAADLDAFMNGTGAFVDPGPPGEPAEPSKAKELSSWAGAIPGGSIVSTIADFANDPKRFGRALQVGVQGVGSGLARIPAMPFDLAGGVIDIGLAGLEGATNLFRDEPVELPRVGPMPLGHQHLTDSASELMDAIGIPPIEREDMSKSERLAYDINSFGGESLAIGSGLNRVANARYPQGTMKGKTAKPGDAYVRPYVGGGATVIGDTAAGAGSGIGYNIATEQFPDFPYSELIGTLLGGVGGVSLAEMPAAAARGTRSVVERNMPSRNVPMGETGVPVNRRVERRAAELAQGMADDPKKAAETIARRANEGAGGPVPTSGLLSGDTGLTSAEQAVRLRDRAPFIQRDQQVARRASDDIASLQDPDANVRAAQDEAIARPGQLADDRDAAALPLLRQAEQSGAVVDPQPVVDRIDQMLGEAKRPAVVNALKDARRMLNRAGTEELDTSVSGLYETRKAINDLIEGRTDTPTGRYAKKELIEVRDLLDEQINAVAPEFGQYLKTYREGSVPINELRDSAQVAKLMEQEPRDVANQLLSGNSYASPERMREITNAIGNNPEAVRGWRSAVAEVLSDKVRNTGGDLAREGTEGPVSIAKMRRVFNQHRGALEGVFSPEDMAVLDRAHELLSPLENRRLQATSGSPTAENAMLAGAWDALGTALTFKYGAVPAGMMMHRLKRAANLAPGLKNYTLDNQALAVVNKMWFDPDLAKHLLEADVSTIQGPGWNAKLNRLIAGTEYLRADEDEDEDNPLMRAIRLQSRTEDPDELMEAIGGR